MKDNGASSFGSVIGNEIAQGAKTASAIGLTYTFDSRVSGLNPNAGILFQIGSDVAGLGGDSEYIRTTGKLVAQTKVYHEEVTLRATLQGGVFSWRGGGYSRIMDRFLLTNDVMRGFEPSGMGPRDQSGGADDAIGGNYFAVASFEAEFPLGLPEELGLKGGVFYDIGNVWDVSKVDTSGATIIGANGSARHVIGFSLLWTTGLGPLRFNFSKALKKESYDKEQSFDLTLQTTF